MKTTVTIFIFLNLLIHTQAYESKFHTEGEITYVDYDSNGSWDTKYIKYRGTYILYKEKWIQVNNSKADLSKIGATHHTGKFYFVNGKWTKKEIEKDRTNKSKEDFRFTQISLI
jgi:hypothetical protein